MTHRNLISTETLHQHSRLEFLGKIVAYVVCFTLIGCTGATPFSTPVSRQQAQPSFSLATLKLASTVVGLTSGAAVITLQNPGPASLKLQPFTITSGFSLQLNTCVDSLPASGSCSVSVTFQPLVAGDLSGVLSVSTESGLLQVSLSGTGKNLDEVVISSTSPQFADTAIGSATSTDSFVIANLGSTTLQILAITATGDFTPQNVHCQGSLAGHMQCGLAVVFAPTYVGIRQGSLHVHTDEGDALLLLSGTAKPFGSSGLNSSVSYDGAVRFLQQAAFGPNPALVAQVQTLGMAGWLDQGLKTPAYDYGGAAGSHPGQYYRNTQNSSTALRQRVSLALTQIFVVGDTNVCNPSDCGPLWESVIEKQAFGNARELLKTVALNPIMGAFLNNANNPGGTTGGVPNQNFGREFMQLMTIGTVQLEQDGSPTLDPSGKTIPTYDQSNVVAMASALSGWVFPDPNRGFTLQTATVPMLLDETWHDMGAKTILPGITLPAGQGGAADLSSVVDALFQHPNLGPFLSRRLIEHLVKSNPSKSYVERVARVFADDGTGVRGNLGATVRAILLDPEARIGDDNTTLDGSAGHLMEPILYISCIMNSIGGAFTDDQIRSIDFPMGQSLYFMPTIFSYYSPDHRLADGTFAPEAQLLDNAHAVAKMALVYNLLHEGLPGTSLDWRNSPFWNCSSESELLDRIDHLLYHGTMGAEIRSALSAYMATDSTKSPNDWTSDVLFLAFATSSYQVIR